MPANLENSAVPTGLEKISFHSNSKERQCQRMFKLLYSCTYFTCQQGNVQNPSSQASSVPVLRTSRCTRWIQKRQKRIQKRLQVHGLSSCAAMAQQFQGIQDPPNPGIKPVSLALACGFLTPGSGGKYTLLFLVFWFSLSFLITLSLIVR